MPTRSLSRSHSTRHQRPTRGRSHVRPGRRRHPAVDAQRPSAASAALATKVLEFFDERFQGQAIPVALNGDIRVQRLARAVVDPRFRAVEFASSILEYFGATDDLENDSRNELVIRRMARGILKMAKTGGAR
jgi:hypothetical protein